MSRCLYIFLMFAIVVAVEPGRVVVLDRTFEVPVEMENMPGQAKQQAATPQIYRPPRFNQKNEGQAGRVVTQDSTYTVPVTVSRIAKPVGYKGQKVVLEPMIEWEKMDTTARAINEEKSFRSKVQTSSVVKTMIHNYNKRSKSNKVHKNTGERTTATTFVAVLGALCAAWVL